jgi:pimeloyl-ACP methyl ester carboxylesterase
MTTVEANGVALGVERFGEAAAPLVLLAGGTTMLSWPDALCEALARRGRHVVRYDLRDSGASTTVDPEAPAYTLRDLADDAAALARKLDDRPAHLAGIGVGGMVARSLRSTTPRRSRRSPWSERDPSLRAGSTTTCLTMTRRRWTGCSRARCPTGPTAPRWRSLPPQARRSSVTTPPLRVRPPSAGGTAPRAHSPRCRWPISWAWCSPGLTANRAGASACRSSRDPGAGGARSPRPVLPHRQRRSARARDPGRTAARARAGRDGYPRCGRR